MILCMTVCALLLLAAPVFAQPSDIQGHWAEQTISKWVDSGYINGYPDGTFRPDNSITRAAGYITGFPDGTMRPDSPVSREQTATIVMYINKLKANAGAANGFTDAAAMIWSKGAIGAVAEADIMNGYPDQTFQPFGLLTRAGAVVTLERALAAGTTSVSYNTAGTYGPETGTETLNGTVYINVAGVTLQNMIITGDLVLAEGIGEGNATLNNVTVKGKTTIKGGGSHSLFLENCSLGETIIQKAGVRVVASGNTTVSVVRLETGATLVTETNSFGQVIASAEIPAGGFTLAKMRDVFGGGSVVTFDGTLTAGSEVVDISLEVTLP